MMKSRIQVTIDFELDHGDDTIEQTMKYLEQSSNFEVLEWIPEGSEVRVEVV